MKTAESHSLQTSTDLGQSLLLQKKTWLDATGLQPAQGTPGTSCPSPALLSEAPLITLQIIPLGKSSRPHNPIFSHPLEDECMLMLTDGTCTILETCALCGSAEVRLVAFQRLSFGSM